MISLLFLSILVNKTSNLFSETDFDFSWSSSFAILFWSLGLLFGFGVDMTYYFSSIEKASEFLSNFGISYEVYNIYMLINIITFIYCLDKIKEIFSGKYFPSNMYLLIPYAITAFIKAIDEFIKEEKELKIQNIIKYSTIENVLQKVYGYSIEEESGNLLLMVNNSPGFKPVKIIKSPFAKEDKIMIKKSNSIGFETHSVDSILRKNLFFYIKNT